MFVSLHAPYVVHEESVYTRSLATETAAGFYDMGVGAVEEMPGEGIWNSTNEKERPTSRLGEVI